MSRKHPCIPKGKACRLDLSPEYDEGVLAVREGKPYINPYDYWAEYTEHYAWDIGYQEGKNGR